MNLTRSQDRSNVIKQSFSKNPVLETNQYESNPNSINNSLRIPATTMATHVKLHSNLLSREKSISNKRSSDRSEVVDYRDQSHDTIKQRLANQIKISSLTPTT